MRIKIGKISKNAQGNLGFFNTAVTRMPSTLLLQITSYFLL